MTIKKGDECPIFSLPNQDGKMVNIQEFIGGKNLVIFFYPKDNSWGCTKEVCSFQESHNEFEDLDCEVIGISTDSVESHKSFSKKHHLNFTLLSDSKDVVRNMFGVPGSFLGLMKGRVTYVIDKSGIVKGVFNSQINSVGHISKAIKLLQKLK